MKVTLYAALAGLCWGIGEVCTKSALDTKQIGPLAIVTVRCAVALPAAILAYLLLAQWMGAEAVDWTRISSGTWLKLILGSGLMAGFGGAFFFYLALTFGDISRVKPIAFTLAPAVAVLLGWWLLGEEMTARRLAGVAMILAGVVVLTAK